MNLQIEHKFPFLQPFEDTSNGLYFNDIFLPEEVVQIILSYVPPKELLSLTLTCKKWCNIIKSEILWMHIYNRHHSNRAKRLPWYVYYCYFTTNNFRNLLKNGNGEQQLQHWKVIRNGGDGFRIEDEPCGSDPLPENVPEFNGHKSCFATSFHDCCKMQRISLHKKRLLSYIMQKFRPRLYASEWVAGRSDCGCYYVLGLKGYSNEGPAKTPRRSRRRQDERSYSDYALLFHKTKEFFPQLASWEKVEIMIEKCPPELETIVFQHMGRDTQYWKGYYGSKMAGAVLRFELDSIEPLLVEDELEVDQRACIQ